MTQDEATSRYALTFKLVMIANRQLASTEMSEICLPVLRRVAEQTSQLTRLAVANDDELRWIAQVQGNLGRVRLHAELGYPVALHASASGKAWLASLSSERALEIALRKGLEKRTPNTITHVEGLIADLKEVRDRGYALALEEGDIGVVAIAVPIEAPNQSDTSAVGTLSVSGLAHDLDRERLEAFVPVMKEAAEELSAFWFGRYEASPGGVANANSDGRLSGTD